ncbi:UNVERIFIED_CONTAM: hypothetical protein GTU68_019865 [Idotea baltica]|nr:hypothetical protein [Idotea baltica]
MSESTFNISHPEVDDLDLKIITILIENARTPYTEIAKRLFVSGGTVHVRMKKLEKLGIVKKQQLIVDYGKLGYDITAFLGIFLTRSSEYGRVVNDLEKIPELVGVHYTTGNYSMFAKIICKDTQHLREVLHEKVQSIEGINRTETLISLEESINRPLKMIQLDDL